MESFPVFFAMMASYFLIYYFRNSNPNDVTRASNRAEQLAANQKYAEAEQILLRLVKDIER